MKLLYTSIFVLTGLLIQFTACDHTARPGKKTGEEITQDKEACNDESFADNTGPLTVQIGNQEWMAYNLNTAVFRNGDSIADFKNWEEWNHLGKNSIPASAYYDNDPDLGKIYGRLYNWYAVNDPRGICPEGFRIPTEEDFVELIFFIWDQDDYNVEEIVSALSDGGSSGFNAQFGGWCCIDYVDPDGKVYEFINIHNNAALWTSERSEDSPDSYEKYALNLDIGTTWRSDTYGVYIDESHMSLAFSVRCIKN